MPLALEPDRFEQPATQEATTESGSLEILTVGRLGIGERYKGVDDVIEAVRIVARRDQQVRYTIIGDGNDRGRLEQHARDEGVAEQVDFRGKVSDEALTRAFQRADAFVMPSAGEGFGLVYLEAMYFGLPIVASPEGGAQYVVDHQKNGLEVPYGQPGALAEALIRLTDDSLRGELARGARRDLEERFSFERFAWDLDAILSRHADDKPVGLG